MATSTIAPGVRVRLTGVFLKNTGQRTGGEGQRIWTVRACDCGLCAGGEYCAVDQDMAQADGGTTWHTPAEVQADPRLRWRHLVTGNLQIIGVRRAADYP